MNFSTPFVEFVSADAKFPSSIMKFTFGGNKMTKTDWQINIQNTAESVAAKYGNDVAVAVFRRYDATCFEDLNPAYYAEAFADLMQIDEDE